MKSRLCRVCLTLFLILQLALTPAQALNAPHYDLASLYCMAELVVEVTEGEMQTTGHEVMCEVTVVKAHKGPVEVGQKLKVRYSGFSREDQWGGEKTSSLKFKKALLFLYRYEKEPFYRPRGDGVRLIEEKSGWVYGFRQFSNPGGYSVTLSSPVILKLKPDEKFTEDRLQDELALSIKHAKAFEQDLAKSDPNELRPYLKSPWENTWSPYLIYKFADVAASRICEIGRPADWFELLLHEKEYRTTYDSRNMLNSKLLSSEAFDFLITVLEKENVTDAEVALAVENLSNSNGRRMEKKKEAREAQVLQQRPSSESRILSLLRKSEKPTVKIAAAQLLAYWHPGEPMYSKQPVPLSDSWVSALKDSVEREKDAATKTVLIRWYCRMGGIEAYKQYFKGDSGIIAFEPERQNHFYPYLKYDIVDLAYWQKDPGKQYVEATALDGLDAGKVFSSSMDRQARTSPPDPDRWLLTGYSMNVNFEPQLKPGNYALRMVCKLKVNGEQENWRSEPVNVTVPAPGTP